MKIINKGTKIDTLSPKGKCSFKYCNEYVYPPDPKKKILYCSKFCLGSYIEEDTISQKGDKTS
jgi:hypothetical protein